MNTTFEDSFISAWSKARFPEENRTFVKSFCEDIGIASFEYVPADYRWGSPQNRSRVINVPMSPTSTGKSANVPSSR